MRTSLFALALIALSTPAFAQCHAVTATSYAPVGVSAGGYCQGGGVATVAIPVQAVQYRTVAVPVHVQHVQRVQVVQAQYGYSQGFVGQQQFRANSGFGGQQRFRASSGFGGGFGGGGGNVLNQLLSPQGVLTIGGAALGASVAGPLGAPAGAAIGAAAGQILGGPR